MVILEGVNGSFIGNQSTIFDALEKVREAIALFQGRDRKILINRLKQDKKQRDEYAGAFDMISNIYGFTKEQKRCYDYIKKYLK